MSFLGKNFRTKLSTQFAAFTTMLIAITVFCIAWYSIATVNNLATQITAQSKDLNDSISITLFQRLGELISAEDYKELDSAAQKMVDSNIVATVVVKDKATKKVILHTQPSEKLREVFKENKISDKALRKKGKTLDDAIYKQSVTKDGKLIELGFYNEPITKLYLDMLRDNMLAMVFIFIFLGFFLSNLISGILIKPINILIKSLGDFAKGNFSHRLEETNYLEINRLIRSYNEMAESLEKLYQSLEQQVKDRTKELEAAYSELKSTQAMMVHSEKMKSLGELVAGITHEINNPVNFIYGNLIHLKNYTADMMSVINQYSEFDADLTEEHKQKIKELKEKGYQLKAIRMILHNKKPEASGISLPDSVATDPLPTCNREHHPTAAAKPDRQNADKTNLPVNTLSAEERMAQFRELMSDIVGHAIAQNNEALTLDISKEIRETVLKEMNYLIREQNDMTEERYRQLSAEIRGKLQKKHTLFSKKEKVPKMKTSKKEKNRKNVLNPV